MPKEEPCDHQLMKQKSEITLLGTSQKKWYVDEPHLRKASTLNSFVPFVDDEDLIPKQIEKISSKMSEVSEEIESAFAREDSDLKNHQNLDGKVVDA